MSETTDPAQPHRTVEPSPPTDQPQGDTESRVEQVDEEQQVTPDEVKREQGYDEDSPE